MRAQTNRECIRHPSPAWGVVHRVNRTGMKRASALSSARKLKGVCGVCASCSKRVRKLGASIPVILVTFGAEGAEALHARDRESQVLAGAPVVIGRGAHRDLSVGRGAGDYVVKYLRF